MQVRDMRRGDLPEVADLLAEAFADGTNLASFVPPRQRVARLRRWFTVVGEQDALRHGLAEVALAEAGPGADARILAVAWWHPPVRPGSAVGAGCRLGVPRSRLPRSRLRELACAVRVFGARVPAAAWSDAASRRARPTEPHWHLSYLASRSEPGARGAATALLQHRLGVADADGTGAHLESSSIATIAFYERFGWRVTGPVRGPAGRSTTAMWRPPGGVAP
ncbi:hypothetical protein I601_3233 [Nocardioides dokdonensis FR1436]|uniref:N-acetyltransferase domain-containing protein n=1 Tax=Nocardioides dokdonensis FR1436 TaxID=1300347 RepID=A0A1A9GPQ1_9ACTN|nr:hypothetical protein [Nocardioides dokdonensis]ANH39640.1 hypothetical protein I601_3233 [Nocardioides dokdonensis FR1436]